MLLYRFYTFAKPMGKKDFRLKIKCVGLLSFIIFFVTCAFAQTNNRQKPRTRTLIVFFDGLRPDYITKEAMPNLYAFSQAAAVGRKHHSVFPTVTRVNSASYATGSYPGTHGILGNSVFFPEVNASKSLNTSYADLTTISQTIQGPLLTAKSLGEILKASGEKMIVFSSGTTGQAFLQNHTVNGAIVNPELVLPESFFVEVAKKIGVPPAAAGEKNAKHRWITDAFLEFGLAKNGPLVSAIWYSDPDGAAHEYGIGSAPARTAIHYVDEQFGRIVEALKKNGATDQYNIIISTDHGFVTHTGKTALTNFLMGEGFKKEKTSDDIVVADGAIYVKNSDPATISKVVESLHRQPWVGAIFTRGAKNQDPLGWVKGTLSLELVHCGHPARQPDILVAVNWDDRKNERGYAGSDFATGVAGHGGSSPYEINIALFAKGPAFKPKLISQSPTSNIDIVPTVLAIYGFPKPDNMDGRVMSEMLRGKTSGKAETVKTEVISNQVTYPWGTYKVAVWISKFAKSRYIDYTRTERKPE